MEKEASIDSLARMVAEGFLDIKQNMNERFDSVEGRLDTVENRLEKVENRLDRIEIKVEETNIRIDRVIMPTLDDHASRIKDLELAR